MTKELEEYFHFQSCISCLESAKNILEIIKKEEGKDNLLLEAAFKFALIEYSKPYKDSYGSNKEKFKLQTSYIPQHLLQLHKRIIDVRDQVHAHSDIKPLDLQIEKVREDIEAKGSFQEVTGLEELPNLDKIIELIDITLANLDMSNKAETLKNKIFNTQQQ